MAGLEWTGEVWRNLTGALGCVKHIEHMRQILIADPIPAIRHRKYRHGRRGVNMYENADFFLLPRVVDGIIKQVNQHLLDQTGVHGDHKHFAGDAHDDGAIWYAF